MNTSIKPNALAGKNAGFSLTELLISLVIVFILSGLATYAFVGVSEQFRIRAAVQSVDAIMRRARQTAVSTRTDRRVVIEMYRDPAFDPTLSPENIPVRMWIEKKKIQFLKWQHLPYDRDPDRVEIVSDVTQLPEFMRVSDVSGLDAPAFYAEVAPGSGRVLLYFEFSNTGSVRAYFNSLAGRDRSLGDTARSLVPGSGSDAVYLHVVRKNEQLEAVGKVGGSDVVFYYLPSGRVFYLDASTGALNLSQIFPLGGGLTLNAITGNEPAISEYEAARRVVNRQLRRQVGTIHVVPQTGRARAYDYGIGFPWSVAEIQEELG